MTLERACLCGNVINHCLLQVNNLFLMRKRGGLKWFLGSQNSGVHCLLPFNCLQVDWTSILLKESKNNKPLMGFEPVNRYAAETETVFALLDLFIKT